MFSETVSVWDSSIPVEKSSYIYEDDIPLFSTNKLQIPKDSLTMIDLFCGAGGFSVGCTWAGFFPVLGIDHLKPAFDTWSKNHPNSIGCLGDITKMDAHSIKKMLSKNGVSRINLITGGVPCQGFSIANRKHNAKDNRNFLFLDFMKFVEVFQPDYAILENVSGLRSTAKGKFEKDIKDYMEKLGYSVTVGIVNAVEYGVPQYRQRVLFVGVRTKSGLTESFIIPDGKLKTPDKYINVEAAISDLPQLGNNKQKTKYSSLPKSKYQLLMKGEGDVLISKPSMLYNHAAPNHPPETVKKIDNTPQGAPMYPRFKQRIRLALDAPSPTQLAGGIRPQFQFGHPTQPRGLSIRERARIQSFPDSYEFVGGIVQGRVLTGNAVPPLMVYEIVKPIADDIRKRDKAVEDNNV